MADKVRVFHLIKGLGRGGAEMLLPAMLSCHDRSRFDFSYGYFLDYKNQLVPDLEAQNAAVTCFKANNNLSMLRKIPALVSYIRKHKIDIIHCHLPWAGIVGRIAGKLAGVPVVYTEHNKQERYHPYTRWMNRLTLGWGKQVIAVSQDVELSIKKVKGENFQVRTVVNGVNTFFFDPTRSNGLEIREKYGIPTDAVVIGTVAVFRKQKRLDAWLKLAAKVKEKYAHIWFLLVGDGPLRPDVERWMQELKLDNVVLAGLQKETFRYMAAMDIFLMTSEFEGLPIALLEAMAMKKAIAITSAGGVKEVIVPGHNGIMVPVEDVMHLEEGILELIKTGSLRNSLGEKARETVEARFNLKTMVSEVENIYSTMLET